MRTKLIFNTKELINKINSSREFFEIKENKDSLAIKKKRLTNRGKAFSIELPKKIEITLEVLGLIVGEGYIGDRRFVFANSGEKAVEGVFDFLKQFKLPIWNYLEISFKNKPSCFENQCIRFWENYLKIKIKKIRIRKEFNNLTKYGTIHLMLNNLLIAKLLKEIIETSKRKIEEDRELSKDYMKGIIAAEGNINIKKTTNCVYMVRISASKKSERDHYKRCLEKIGIKIYCEDMPTISKSEAKEKGWKTDKGRAGAVLINRWENFVKIIQRGLLDLNDDKKKKFFKHFENNKFTKQFLEFEYFLDKEFTMKEAQNYFNFKGRHLGRILTLYKQGYITRRKANKVKFVYELTDKYKELYNLLKD